MGDAQRHTWGAKYSLRKAVNPVNRPTESAKMATIQAFCAWRDPSNGGRAVAFGAQTWSRTALVLRLSLPHRHLVNSVDCACWSAARTFDAPPPGPGFGPW